MSYEEEDQRLSVIRREEFSASEVLPMAETAMTAVAAAQKSMIESRLVVALKTGRNWAQIRGNINKLCSDPTFAAEALYVKPITGTRDTKISRDGVTVEWADMTKRERLLAASRDWPRGFSIRFIESVVAEAGHFMTPTTVLWDDDFKRISKVEVFDMCKNTSYDRTIVTTKRIERRFPKKGQVVYGTRANANGDIVSIVDATPAEVATSEGAEVSKAIRTCAERLLPAACKAEWRALIEATLANELASDPDAAKKRMLDSFLRFGVTPEMIEDFLGHPLDAVLPAEFTILRGVLIAVSNGDCVWADVMATKEGETDKDHKPAAGEKKLHDRIAEQRKKEADARASSAKSADPDPIKTDPKTEPARTEAAKSAEPAKSEPPQSGDSSRNLTPEELAELDARDAREAAGERQGGLLTEEDETPITRRKK